MMDYIHICLEAFSGGHDEKMHKETDQSCWGGRAKKEMFGHIKLKQLWNYLRCLVRSNHM